jgi:hypothetical protein
LSAHLLNLPSEKGDGLPPEKANVDFARFGLGADVILLIDRAYRERLPVA